MRARRPPPLTAQLARARAVNNTLIVSVANHAVWDWVHNWVGYIQQQGRCDPHRTP